MTLIGWTLCVILLFLVTLEIQISFYNDEIRFNNPLAAWGVVTILLIIPWAVLTHLRPF